jgi:hypothetical protein
MSSPEETNEKGREVRTRTAVLAVFLAVAAALVAAAGAVWDGDNGNLQNETETSTFNAVLVGSDGSHVGVHETFHMSTSASGGSITFDKPHLTCS